MATKDISEIENIKDEPFTITQLSSLSASGDGRKFELINMERIYPTKDISEIEVLTAVGMLDGAEFKEAKTAIDALQNYKKKPRKVCIAAIEREVNKGNVDYRHLTYRPFLTKKGIKTLARWANENQKNPSLWMWVRFNIHFQSDLEGKVLIDGEIA